MKKFPDSKKSTVAQEQGNDSAITGVAHVGDPSVCAFHRDSLAVPEANKVTVSLKEYKGMVSPNPIGWYYKCANVVLAKDGALVASFQLSDNHHSLASYIVVARSEDGGRTWKDHQIITKANVWEENAVWVAPQMGILKDGRIVIIADWGNRFPGQNMPMLTDWQKPERGMSNHLFWSKDNGRTWSGPEKIDDVGGEPSYIIELSDGTLAFTRTESAGTDKLKNPPMPWGNVYYRSIIVFSDDGGKTWGRTAQLTDSPFHGDCEVGLVELAPGELLAATRIGLGGGAFGHSSRLIRSHDGGRTWDKGEIAPFYGQRVHIAKLQSGNLLGTYRSSRGTPGNRALVFHPDEKIGFQPNSWIQDESRCELSSDALTLRTVEGNEGAVQFILYPAQDDQSRVEIEATLRVEKAGQKACTISAGCWIRFLPNRVELVDHPEVGFAIDADKWHSYWIVRENGILTITVDGKEMLRTKVGNSWVREVRFGNLPRGGHEVFTENGGVSHWRSVSAKVTNADDYSIDWKWTTAQGYPDQFRRDRVVVLDNSRRSDCGYSSWAQLPDGTIAILDYTTATQEFFLKSRVSPLIRAYLVKEQDLVRQKNG
ncbi:exo-alpha-sialidase [Opitutaceae bacterium TAV4]|nr:exo-alpha-sialidase [Opitutaceae bacterium TAV4]RRK02154.1 exo-alpha-sialidase [Opitutaceae bacterium TAV3]